MKRNREGYLISDTHRECTGCGSFFEKRSNTVTLCGSCNSDRVKGESPEVRMYRRAKSRAKETNLPFTIEKSDIKIPACCPILGIPLEIHRGSSGGRVNSPALDRIDNGRGYEKDNILAISHLANMMKSSASVEDLIAFSQWVQRTYVNTAEDQRPSVNTNESNRNRCSS